ncbi:chemotaxis response regulator protein-glutamate methylesterase [Candidatus Magnetomonas plexicatena]|nr:chemotaxis response regulator protein-glutamate methylesterase [Nitrospirales bacterium LBB_01]
MRNTIKSLIVRDPEIVVVGTASDGIEALEKIESLKPDIITLDVEMPRMNGLEALRAIMASSNPLPVIMVSSLTTEGAKTTLEALEIGAVDFIPKNLSELSVNIVNIKDMLLDKLKQIGSKKFKIPRKISPLSKTAMPAMQRPAATMHPSPVRSVQFTSSKRMQMVAIGTSTGGPKALQTIVPLFPKNFSVPVIISQHMPANFTGPFAERLCQLSQMPVKEAKHGEKIENGVVYIAPGYGHMSITKKGFDKFVSIGDDPTYIYKPSVDVMMLTANTVMPGGCLGVILTGMGNDGFKGMRAIKESGGRTIAQDEESCVVFGMPKFVVESGLADKVVSLSEIAGEIINSI